MKCDGCGKTRHLAEDPSVQERTEEAINAAPRARGDLYSDQYYTSRGLGNKVNHVQLKLANLGRGNW